MLYTCTGLQYKYSLYSFELNSSDDICYIRVQVCITQLKYSLYSFELTMSIL